jgi:hypothetical protein
VATAAVGRIKTDLNSVSMPDLVIVALPAGLRNAEIFGILATFVARSCRACGWLVFLFND